jgi:hypothetical protein
MHNLKEHIWKSSFYYKRFSVWYMSATKLSRQLQCLLGGVRDDWRQEVISRTLVPVEETRENCFLNDLLWKDMITCSASLI